MNNFWIKRAPKGRGQVRVSNFLLRNNPNLLKRSLPKEARILHSNADRFFDYDETVFLIAHRDLPVPIEGAEPCFIDVTVNEKGFVSWSVQEASE